MSPSVLTLLLLADLLAPGRRAEPCPVGQRGAAVGGLDSSSPLWSVPAADPERRERRAALPDPRPELECGNHRHELAGPLDLPVGATAAASGAEGDDEDPICVEDSRCSPVPTERSGVIPALKSFKGMVSRSAWCPAPVAASDPAPFDPGERARGYSEPLFRPPR